jgi:hypothetical protein
VILIMIKVSIVVEREAFQDRLGLDNLREAIDLLGYGTDISRIVETPKTFLVGLNTGCESSNEIAEQLNELGYPAKVVQIASASKKASDTQPPPARELDRGQPKATDGRTTLLVPPVTQVAQPEFDHRTPLPPMASATPSNRLPSLHTPNAPVVSASVVNGPVTPPPLPEMRRQQLPPNFSRQNSPSSGLPPPEVPFGHPTRAREPSSAVPPALPVPRSSGARRTTEFVPSANSRRPAEMSRSSFVSHSHSDDTVEKKTSGIRRIAVALILMGVVSLAAGYLFRDRIRQLVSPLLTKSPVSVTDSTIPPVETPAAGSVTLSVAPPEASDGPNVDQAQDAPTSGANRAVPLPPKPVSTASSAGPINLQSKAITASSVPSLPPKPQNADTSPAIPSAAAPPDGVQTATPANGRKNADLPDKQAQINAANTQCFANKTKLNFKIGSLFRTFRGTIQVDGHYQVIATDPPSGNSEFDIGAACVVDKLNFTPAVIGGKPVESPLNIRLTMTTTEIAMGSVLHREYTTALEFPNKVYF